MPATEPLKDVSITLRGEHRPHLIAIEGEWPVPQADIIGAALMKFRELPIDEQGMAIRAAHKGQQGSPRRREKQPA